MRILVFGGTGAMGDPLVKLLSDSGHDVFVTSRRERKYDRDNIHCLVGNAHENVFLESVLSGHYDVLVDFMNYRFSEVRERLDMILRSVGQYIFISSCRVFARSDVPITEETPRLLDVCEDKEYLATEEYALAKAREENLLLASLYKNWTIVRPTVTYNSRRLQLGCYELEDWLPRAVKGRPIVFFDDLADKYTAMTYGEDVARGICFLVGNGKALGEAVNIASPESKKWSEILDIYNEAVEKASNGRCSVQTVMLPHAEKCEELFGRGWRLKYNRIYNRRFDSSKLDILSDGRMSYTAIRTGLMNCMEEFFHNGCTVGSVRALNEAYMDKVTRSCTKLSEFSGWKSRTKYLIARYSPYIALKGIISR